ncbi:MAG: transposase [Sedimentisphaerales bacterium]|nr:transposase [Sedimentisphaerales bacterium]
MESLAYFITFTTYGSWLHGDKRDSIIRCGNDTKLLSPNRSIESYQKGLMKHPPVFLDSKQRKIVLETVIEHCKIKKWKLWAVHVQDNHLHVIVSAEISAEKVMTQLKAWATRRLRENGFNLPKVWTKHGSTRYLNSCETLQRKIEYVIYGQGKMVEYYIDKNLQ